MTARWLAPRRWEPAVRDGLEGLVRSAEGQPLATFDWDNTCIRGDVGEAALAALDARDGSRFLARYEELIATQGKPVAYAFCATALAPVPEPLLYRFATELWSAGLAGGTFEERPEIRELIWLLQRHGWEVWVVSASQETLVQAAASHYGIPADRVVGVRLASEGDLLQPQLAGPLTYRQGKVEAMDARIGRRPDLAVGDTDTDIEMLQAARHRLVIDRGNPELAALARDGDWWVQPAW